MTGQRHLLCSITKPYLSKINARIGSVIKFCIAWSRIHIYIYKYVPRLKTDYSTVHINHTCKFTTAKTATVYVTTYLLQIKLLWIVILTHIISIQFTCAVCSSHQQSEGASGGEAMETASFPDPENNTTHLPSMATTVTSAALPNLRSDVESHEKGNSEGGWGGGGGRDGGESEEPKEPFSVSVQRNTIQYQLIYLSLSLLEAQNNTDRTCKIIRVE